MIALRQFNDGDSVRVGSGRLQGLNGRICGREGAGRALLLLNDYGVLLSIDASVLEKVTPEVSAGRLRVGRR